MQKKRVLIIIYEKYFLTFLLLEIRSDAASLAASKVIRLCKNTSNFVIADYILEAITKWGKEIELELVKDNIPLTCESRTGGVSEIFVLSCDKEADFSSITKDVFPTSSEIVPNGAANINRCVKFKNLLSIRLDSLNVCIERYTKRGAKGMKVVSESKDFPLKSIKEDSSFQAEYDLFSKDFASRKLFNLITNLYYLPSFGNSQESERIYNYLLNSSRLEQFLTCKKLALSDFGEGDLADNILVIGGEQGRQAAELEGLLLAILSVFKIRGNFKIYIDRLNFFNFLETHENQIFSDHVYKELLLSPWGNAFVISPKRNALMEEVTADIDITDGTSKKQLIPMLGKIISYRFSEKGGMKSNLKKNYFIEEGKAKHDYTDLEGNLVIDSRGLGKVKTKSKVKTSKEEYIKQWIREITSN